MQGARGDLAVGPEAASGVSALARSLGGGADVFQNFAVLGSAEWELRDARLVALEPGDAEEVRARGVAYARELSSKYRGAVLVMAPQLEIVLNDGGTVSASERLCAISPTVLMLRETWFRATYGA